MRRPEKTKEEQTEEYAYLSLRLPQVLTVRLEKALTKLNKQSETKYSKQKLIRIAIVDQLQKEQERIIKNTSPRDGGKQVRLKIKKIVADQLQEHMGTLRNWEKSPGSKHSWVIHAIEEKLTSLD